MSSLCADGVEVALARQLSPIVLEDHLTGTSLCDGCSYHEDAPDTAAVPVMQHRGVMHAMTTGHLVHEHIQRSIEIRPVAR